MASHSNAPNLNPTSPPPPPPPVLRRTRFVCVSDTHNHLPKLPKGDVLIHAGDMTNQGSLSELSKTVKWLEQADFEAKIVVAGNHDITLDADFYREHGARFRGNHAEAAPAADCLALLQSSPSITYLCHSSATVRLARRDGPHTEFVVFGSPYSPHGRTGHWAFGYSREDPPPPSSDAASELLWAAIPPSADVVVAHTPPRHHCDGTGTARGPLGCEALRRALHRVRPRLAVCGHVHEARGARTVRWNLGDGPLEAAVAAWEDASGGGRKQALVDLTSNARTGRRGLDNDGGRGPAGCRQGRDQTVASGRRETCVVNCAFLANSYPHPDGKRFNKPIVVDLDLPVWEQGPTTSDGEGSCSGPDMVDQ